MLLFFTTRLNTITFFSLSYLVILCLFSLSSSHQTHNPKSITTTIALCLFLFSLSSIHSHLTHNPKSITTTTTPCLSLFSLSSTHSHHTYNLKAINTTTTQCLSLFSLFKSQPPHPQSKINHHHHRSETDMKPTNPYQTQNIKHKPI